MCIIQCYRVATCLYNPHKKSGLSGEISGRAYLKFTINVTDQLNLTFHPGICVPALPQCGEINDIYVESNLTNQVLIRQQSCHHIRKVPILCPKSLLLRKVRQMQNSKRNTCPPRLSKQDYFDFFLSLSESNHVQNRQDEHPGGAKLWN